MSDRFENNLGKMLAAGSDRVDRRTRDELARRRRLALDDAGRLPVRSRWWLPVGAVAAALSALFLVQPLLDGLNQMPEATVVDSDDVDMEILLAEESLELYEDLEFYQWLDVAGDAG